jgi:hypothetical protein
MERRKIKIVPHLGANEIHLGYLKPKQERF